MGMNALFIGCFNPLKIGSVCNAPAKKTTSLRDRVSIPLKSGRFVIYQEAKSEWAELCFNPLKIGSVCNKGFKLLITNDARFQSP